MNIFIVLITIILASMMMLSIMALFLSIYLFVDKENFLGLIVFGIACTLGYISIGSGMILYPHLK